MYESKRITSVSLEGGHTSIFRKNNKNIYLKRKHELKNWFIIKYKLIEKLW